MKTIKFLGIAVLIAGSAHAGGSFLTPEQQKETQSIIREAQEAHHETDRDATRSQQRRALANNSRQNSSCSQIYPYGLWARDPEWLRAFICPIVPLETTQQDVAEIFGRKADDVIESGISIPYQGDEIQRREVYKIFREERLDSDFLCSDVTYEIFITYSSMHRNYVIGVDKQRRFGRRHRCSSAKVNSQ